MGATATWTFMPLSGKVGEGKFALLDHEDFERFGMWRYCYSGGYAVRGTFHGTPRKQQVLKLHREIMGLEVGDPRRVDHINRDTLDNRKSNLRVATQAQNGQNLQVRSGGTSKYRGVYLHRRTGLWVASVRLNQKKHHLGYFKDEDEAGRVAAEFRLEHMPYSEMDRG